MIDDKIKMEKTPFRQNTRLYFINKRVANLHTMLTSVDKCLSET